MKMGSDNKEKINCNDDSECHVCDKLATERFFNNNL